MTCPRCHGTGEDWTNVSTESGALNGEVCGRCGGTGNRPHADFRLGLRDEPGDDAVGAHISTDRHAGPGRIVVTFDAAFNPNGSPFQLLLEGPWGIDARAFLTRAEADGLRRQLEFILLDSDPEWHAHNARAEAEANDACVACGEPRAEHVGPPSPPLTRGHLGATEDRPGSCLTTTGEHVHNREKRTCPSETA